MVGKTGICLFYEKEGEYGISSEEKKKRKRGGSAAED